MSGGLTCFLKMVFKLLIVLAILVLHTSVCDAQNAANRVPLDKWDLYGTDLLTLVYKRLPKMDEVERANPLCRLGAARADCQVPPPREAKGTERLTSKKRTWDNLDLMKVLRFLSRGDAPESETFESIDYETKPDK